MSVNRKAPSALDKIIQARLQNIKVAKSSDLKDYDLWSFLTAASPHYEAPVHLDALLPYFASIEERPTTFCFSAPPRHGKSVATNHLVARHMLRHPGVNVAYGCYSLDLSAGFFSDEVKDILKANGIPIDRNKNTKEEWRLENGSTFKAVAPGSGFTGRGADLIIIDDPYKNRAAAESGKIREETWNWVKDVCYTRRSPNCSVIVTHTRWNYEDVIGVMNREFDYPVINLPAINAQGEALWPSQWSVERLTKEIRPVVGEYGWASLYMGSPIPHGGAVFKGTHLYSTTPERFKRFAIGIDLAYTKKTHSDYSCAVVIGTDIYDKHHILKVVRKQCEAKDFGAVLQALRAEFGSPPIYWYVGGQEKIVAEYLMHVCKVPIKTIPAKEDKFARAQAVAAAWNAGNILMPDWEPEWSKGFLSEVLSFSGLDDPHDDQVDALAAAFIPSAAKRAYRGDIPHQILSF